MAFCSKCGTKNSDDARFCVSCGAKIEIQSAENENQQDVYVPDETLQEMFLKTSGRLNRKRYFKRAIVLGVLQMLVGNVLGILSLVIYGYIPESVEIFMGIIVILLMIPSYCLMVRRLHDINKDNKIAIGLMVFGLSAIIFFNPENPDNILVYMIMSVIFFGVGIYYFFKDGTHGANKYGPDPLNR